MKIREWMLETYEPETIQDIVNHGCSGGIGGLIYYHETTAFHDKHQAEILGMLYEDATDQGTTIIQLVASFNGGKDVGSMDQFKNLLTWYAVEREANNIINNLEETENETDN